jgi:hypothetical protein
MSVLSWLRQRNPKAGRSPRVRPQLESLDDRLVPSTLHVTNHSDNPTVKGSLPYELAHTNGSGRDTIVIDVTGQINLQSELVVSRGVTIEGPGAGLLTLTTNYNFGDPWGQSTRVFEVNATRPVVISGLSIADNGVNDYGAAVFNHSTLTMRDCDISNNLAGLGGGIYNDGTLALSGCTLKDDRADQYGGGVYNAGTLTVTGCTLSFDNAYGFNSLGGGIYNAGTLTVGTSTFVMDGIFGPYSDLGGNTFITQQPQIGSFTASAGTVNAGDSLTLTATNITDANPGASITGVQIYVNGYGGTPFGNATQSSPGVWTFTFSTAGWSPGTYTFYAAAMDSYGVGSLLATITVQVV